MAPWDWIGPDEVPWDVLAPSWRNGAVWDRQCGPAPGGTYEVWAVPASDLMSREGD